MKSAEYYRHTGQLQTALIIATVAETNSEKRMQLQMQTARPRRISSSLGSVFKPDGKHTKHGGLLLALVEVAWVLDFIRALLSLYLII